MKKRLLLAFVALLSLFAVQAQTNLMLENWTLITGPAPFFTTADSPDDWLDNSAIYEANYMAPSTLFKETTDVGEGAVSARMVTDLWVAAGFNLPGFIQQQVAFTGQPSKLSFKAKANPMAGDFNVVTINLTYWDVSGDSAITVAFGMATFDVATSSWFSVDVPLTYIDATLPDSMLITAASSGIFVGGPSIVGSEFLVDSFALDMSAPCPTASIGQSGGTTCGWNNGWAWATAVGGIFPYTFVWNTGQVGDFIGGVGAGVYSCTVTDAGGCADVTWVTISGSTGVNVTATSTTSTCGGADGTASATATGQAPFSYLWTNGGTTSTISGLAPGVQLVTVTDGNNCMDVNGVGISNTGAPAISVTAPDLACGGYSNGVATVLVVGGATPVTYAWEEIIIGSPMGTTQTITGLIPGVYVVTVTDVNGCVAIDGEEIDAPPGINAAIVTTMATCGGTDGTATVYVQGGVTPYSYSWFSGATTAAVSNLGAAIVSVTITDANGCLGVDINAVQNAGGVSISMTSGDLSCNGANDGWASVTLSGGVTPYQYIGWTDILTGTNYGSSLSITGLAAGLYVITVVDANSCATFYGDNIDSPDALTVTVDGTDETVGGANDGSVWSNVAGGTSPYVYAWSNGSTTASMSGIPPANYVLVVTDDNGCGGTDFYMVNGAFSCTMTVNVTATDGTCDQYGYGVASTTGATGTVFYMWSNGGIGDYTDFYWDGTFSVSATDMNGCLAVASVTVTNLPSLNYTFTNTEPSCGSNDGEIVIINASGATPFTYIWANGMTTDTITGLAPGAYLVTATDANGCTRWTGTGLANIGAPTITLNIDNVNCEGGSDGAVTVTATGGATPYTYAWSDIDDMSIILGTDSTMSNLTANLYIVTVTDANGCISLDGESVQEPGIIEIALYTSNATNVSATDGWATASVSGGSGTGYTYLWSEGTTAASAMNLVSGTYSITVTDSNGCTNVASGVVNYDGGCLMNINIINIQNASNVGGTDGSATASVTGGDGVYAYTWSGGLTLNSATAQGLVAGSYSVTVTDGSGCSVIGSVAITEPGTSIVVEFTNETTLTVYPNPSNGRFQVKFENATRAVYELKIVNMVGQIVYVDRQLINGDSTQRINLTQLDDGIYFMSVRNGEQEITKKLIIGK